MLLQSFAKFVRVFVIGLSAAALPTASRADLLYTHYFYDSDVEPLQFSLSPEAPNDNLQIEFFLGVSGSSESTGVVSLQQGLNTIDFSGALLTAMRQKSADGVIDPSEAGDRWGLYLLFAGAGGLGGSGSEPEAYDVQNEDTPERTDYDPAYLAALTGADIQSIRLVVREACFDGQTFFSLCGVDGGEAGFVGRISLEFFGERRQNIPEPAMALLMSSLLIAGIVGGTLRRKVFLRHGRAWRPVGAPAGPSARAQRRY